MFKWFREHRRDIKFAWGLEQAAQHQFDAGVISYDQLCTARTASQDRGLIREVRNQLMVGDGLLGGVRDWNWEAIKNWIIEFLIPVLKAILPLLLVV